MEIRLVATKNYVVQGQRAVRAVKGSLGNPCTFENVYHDYVIVNVLPLCNSSLRCLLLQETGELWWCFVSFIVTVC